MSGDDDARLNNDYILVVRSWLLVASRDIRSAHACLDAPVPIPETAAYHCQQAVEKLAKGLLVLARVPFRKTHDLEALRDLVVPHFPDLAHMIDRLVPLTDWGHIFRYPDLGGEPVPSPQELRSSLADIQLFAERVTALIDPTPSG
jgi:HEPN domain-containing protein